MRSGKANAVAQLRKYNYWGNCFRTISFLKIDFFEVFISTKYFFGIESNFIYRIIGFRIMIPCFKPTSSTFPAPIRKQLQLHSILLLIFLYYFVFVGLIKTILKKFVRAHTQQTNVFNDNIGCRWYSRD